MESSKDVRTKDFDARTDEWRPDHDEVANLAYSYYLKRGCGDGMCDDDWFRAEQELKRRHGMVDSGTTPRTVIGVFNSMDDAQRAFDDLEREGYIREDISFIANKASTSEWTEPAGDRTPNIRDTGGDVAADAGVGAAVGGVSGLLLSIAGLAVPGVGPVLAAGPIIAALGGAGVGAAAGGLIGALADNGVPSDRAGYYAEGVRRGAILITVTASGTRADHAAEILESAGAMDIDDRVSDWRERGWIGYDSNAQPLTEAELRREREYYSAASRQGEEWTRRSRAGPAGGLTGAGAANARKDAMRTTRQGKKSMGTGRRDVQNQDLSGSAATTTGQSASEQRRRVRIYPN